MNAPLVTNKQDEAIKAAARLLGIANAEQVLRLMYQLGYMDGLLAMGACDQATDLTNTTRRAA